ncbi:hypothetical protein HCA61_12030 [Rhodococcus sp. HNM0563]|uniref:hypothetical protein n=1 Tax=unclassified Rhodococcus (in: high G+C Gram-positive bacteria) TaxID=192944 RepID=UPI00146ECA6A|nr:MULTISPECIES: hypothetical protein [unclassified Rhodococcus (in: high G+C Gram-positive bacteria)]MCK0089463.1 hypothetical protein [Rhodococcus sp. F64268]NLU62992.1 hypothetical protein [Rhodococcus sp. HNM0563]
MSDKASQGLPAGVVRADEWTGLGNEFAGVQFRKVWTRNGERLELYVPRTGSRILLDPMALEVLADQEPAFFTGLIATRLGSHD